MPTWSLDPCVSIHHEKEGTRSQGTVGSLGCSLVAPFPTALDQNERPLWARACSYLLGRLNVALGLQHLLCGGCVP